MPPKKPVPAPAADPTPMVTAPVPTAGDVELADLVPLRDYLVATKRVTKAYAASVVRKLSAAGLVELRNQVAAAQQAAAQQQAPDPAPADPAAP